MRLPILVSMNSRVDLGPVMQGKHSTGRCRSLAELQAYTAADQVTAEQGEGDEPRPPRRSAGGAHGLSGLFEIEGIESPVELNSHPGITTFLRQIFHNLNGGSPGNAVDELINYYENVIRGHINM